MTTTAPAVDQHGANTGTVAAAAPSRVRVDLDALTMRVLDAERRLETLEPARTDPCTCTPVEDQPAPECRVHRHPLEAREGELLQRHDMIFVETAATWGTAFAAQCACDWESGQQATAWAAEDEAHRHKRLSEPPEVVATTDQGVVPFPSYCPSWCDREQRQLYARENAGAVTVEEMSTHHRVGGHATLLDLHNAVSHDSIRSGGGFWDVDGIQRPAEMPLVRVAVGDLTPHRRVAVEMTTGEARVYAAHIAALCDRLDLGEATR